MKQLLILLIAICIPSRVIAHSDPLGEVFPDVRVQGGQFVVYFEDNRERKQAPIDGRATELQDVNASYRMVVSPSGEILKTRESAQLPSSLKPPIEMRGYHRPIVTELEKKYYVLPRQSGEHCGTPFMYEVEERSISKLRFRRGKDRISSVHSAVIQKNSVALVATRESEIPPEKRGPDFQYGSFTFFLFAQTGSENSVVWDQIAQQDIGMPTRIYFTPVASDLVSNGANYYLAWAGVEGDEPQLKLTRWNPKLTRCDDCLGDDAAGTEDQIQTIKLAKSDWNLSISIGIIEENLLVAYHELGKIKLIHVNLNEQFAPSSDTPGVRDVKEEG